MYHSNGVAKYVVCICLFMSQISNEISEMFVISFLYFCQIATAHAPQLV